jgi:hypothetical protein
MHDFWVPNLVVNYRRKMQKRESSLAEKQSSNTSRIVKVNWNTIKKGFGIKILISLNELLNTEITRSIISNAENQTITVFHGKKKGDTNKNDYLDRT